MTNTKQEHYARCVATPPHLDTGFAQADRFPKTLHHEGGIVRLSGTDMHWLPTFIAGLGLEELPKVR